MLESLAHEAFLQIRSQPVVTGLLFVLFCALLATFLRKGEKKVKAKTKTGDLARTEHVVGDLGNLDQAPARRRVRAAFRKKIEELNHPLFQESLEGVKAEEFLELNSRGVEVFTRSWFPESKSVRAIVFICHGYGDTCTFFFEGVARMLAKCGYAVFGMDYAGFGLTSGLHCFVPSFDKLVDDVVENYSKIKARPDLRKLPCFLFGESMGGAVSLKIHLKQPDAWNGAVLVAPMCKIAADMYPPWLLLQILIFLSYFFPKAKLVPEKNLADMAFRDVGKRQQTAYNVAAYKDRPRLKTALEMLRATDEISSRLNDVSLPLLILHGECDIVTDPSISKALHEQAKSTDKTLHIYKDAWHSVLEGEPDDGIFQAFNDIRYWLDAHTTIGDEEQ